MEGTLLVTPERLESTAADFATKANLIKTLHDDMQNTVKTLSGSWQGVASEAYAAKFAALQSAMETINRMINEHSRDLIEMAREFTAAENKATGMANDLPQSNL